MHDYLNFIIIFFLLAITPGLDLAMVLKNTLLFDKKKTIYTIVGISMGVLFYAILITIGLSLINLYLIDLMIVIKYLGGAYLLYVGVMTIFFSKKNWQKEEFSKTLSKKSSINYFLEGLFCNLLNPKVVIFLISLFSFFIKDDFPIHKKTIYILSVFLICFFWFFLVNKIFSHKILSKKILVFQNNFSKIIGLFFILFSINLIFF